MSDPAILARLDSLTASVATFSRLVGVRLTRAYGLACAMAERERLAAWLDQEWPADAHEERAHRAYIAAAIRKG